jgi:nucleoside-diphosphate-sugar epimerase
VELKTVLILGSSGQIGAHLSKYLEAKSYKVLEFDIENSISEDLRINQNNYFESLVQQSDFVFFLAFDVGGSHYIAKYQDTFDFIDNNLKILLYTMNALKKYNKPFLFASSQMSNMSQSTYGILKAIGERFTYSTNGKVVKFWNVYGHEKDEKKFHVISDFIKMAKEYGEIRMRTDGHETRDFLYADDCCEGLEAIMLNFNKFSKDQELHLANFEWNSILEVAKIIAENFNSTIIPGNSIDNVQQGIKNEPSKYLLDFWQPSTTLKDGIQNIIQIEDNSL